MKWALTVTPWTWRQQTNLLAWHSGQWWCITIPSLVTEGSAAEEILSRWTFTEILNFFCDHELDHNTAIQSFQKTIKLLMMHHQTKFSCKRISSSDDILKSHVLIVWSLTVTLTLKTVNKSYWKTIWLIMMHHHIKFRRYLDKHSEHFETLLWPWPWTQQSNFSIRHSGLW